MLYSIAAKLEHTGSARKASPFIFLLVLLFLRFFFAATMVVFPHSAAGTTNRTNNLSRARGRLYIYIPKGRYSRCRSETLVFQIPLALQSFTLFVLMNIHENFFLSYFQVPRQYTLAVPPEARCNCRGPAIIRFQAAGF